MDRKIIIRNGKKVTLIRFKGDTNWQFVEKTDG